MTGFAKYLTLIFTISSILSCTEVKIEPNIQFYLDGKSDFTIINQKDSLLAVKFEKWSSIPLEMVSVDTLLKPGAQFSIDLPNQNMDYFSLVINEKSFSDIFLFPGYEVTVVINQGEDASFQGDFAEVNRFLYENSKINLGFNALNTIRAQATHEEKDFSKFIAISDSVYNLQKNNIDKNKSKLPDWYVKVEKERLIYRKVGSILNSISYRNNLLKIEDDIPKDFEESLFSSLQIENDKFIGESNYMMFLSDYLNFVSKGKTPEMIKRDAGVPLIIQSAREVTDLFSNPVRDAMLAFRSSMIIRNLREEFDPSVLEFFENDKWRDFIKEYYQSVVTLKPGTKLPFFTLVDREGEYVEAPDFLGNILLINFWASWCKPCIEEFPYENQLVEKYRDKPVKIINICIETPLEKWEEYIDRFGLKMENYFANDVWTKKLKIQFDIQSLPHALIVDRNGNIVENRSRRASNGVDELLDDLLEI
jgi:thiol-disulfide isomerase/thioredoxin